MQRGAGGAAGEDAPATRARQRTARPAGSALGRFQPSASGRSSTTPKRAIGCLADTSIASSTSAPSRRLKPEAGAGMPRADHGPRVSRRLTARRYSVCSSGTPATARPSPPPIANPSTGSSTASRPDTEAGLRAHGRINSCTGSWARCRTGSNHRTTPHRPRPGGTRDSHPSGVAEQGPPGTLSHKRSPLLVTNKQWKRPHRTLSIKVTYMHLHRQSPGRDGSSPEAVCDLITAKFRCIAWRDGLRPDRQRGRSRLACGTARTKGEGRARRPQDGAA